MDDCDAMPTVVPAKAPPLWTAEEVHTVISRLWLLDLMSSCHHHYIHDELGVVVTEAWQQLSTPPLQEVVEGVGGVFFHLDLVPLTPHL